MTEIERIEAILRALPRGPDCTDQVIADMAERIVLLDHLAGKFEPLPEAQREDAKSLEAEIEVADRLTAFGAVLPLLPLQDARAALDNVRDRVHLKGGQPKRSRAKVLTAVCDTAFHSITGRAAPRSRRDGRASGPLVDLVEAVFAALGVKAKAGSQVKSYWDGREKTDIK